MLADYLIAPSLNSLFISGLTLLFILIILIINFREVNRFTTFQKLSILAVLTIAISSHGLVHLGVEQQYNFNPYTWI